MCNGQDTDSGDVVHIPTAAEGRYPAMPPRDGMGSWEVVPNVTQSCW